MTKQLTRHNIYKHFGEESFTSHDVVEVFNTNISRASAMIHGLKSSKGYQLRVIGRESVAGRERNVYRMKKLEETGAEGVRSAMGDLWCAMLLHPHFGAGEEV